MGADLELRRRLERFDLDAGAFPGYFSGRLARENNWTLAFAERVVGEYRRYAYLACTADHVVVPSDEVDMAWHQHLLDTEQYWGEFCRTVLHRPLHHRPNKGGGAGRQDHLDLYRRTLQTYERTFGREPPQDVWPPPERRFAEPGPRQKALARHRFAPTMRSGVVIGLAVALPLTVAWSIPTIDANAALDLDETGWTDTMALAALASAAVLALLVSYGLRRALFNTVSAEHAGSLGVELDVYDAAMLNTDSKLAVNVAVAALVFDDVLRFDEESLTKKVPQYRLVRGEGPPARAHPLERATVGVVSSAEGPVSLSDVHARMRPHAMQILTALRERELLRSPHPFLGRRLAIAFPILVVVGLGVAALPTAGDSATGSILIAMVVLIIVGIGMSAAPPMLTNRGRDALEVADTEHPSLFPADDDDVDDGRTLSWVIALQGTAVLDGHTLSMLREAINAPAEQGGGGRGVPRAGCGGGGGREEKAGGLGGGGGSGCGGGCGGN